MRRSPLLLRLSPLPAIGQSNFLRQEYSVLQGPQEQVAAHHLALSFLILLAVSSILHIHPQHLLLL